MQDFKESGFMYGLAAMVIVFVIVAKRIVVKRIVVQRIVIVYSPLGPATMQRVGRRSVLIVRQLGFV